MLRKKDEDRDDKENENIAVNQSQTFKVPDGGSTKLNTSETTTDQQGKGGQISPYKVNK